MDGLGSLAFVIGLLAVVFVVPKKDLVAGLVITGLIVYLLVREGGPVVASRVMDQIDPDVILEIQKIVSAVPEVLAAYACQMARPPASCGTEHRGGLWPHHH